MLNVVSYDEEKGEIHVIVNGSSALLTFDPQRHTTGIWKLIFRAMAEDAVAEHGEMRIE